VHSITVTKIKVKEDRSVTLRSTTRSRHKINVHAVTSTLSTSVTNIAPTARRPARSPARWVSCCVCLCGVAVYSFGGRTPPQASR
jgi:hypothetical protein